MIGHDLIMFSITGEAMAETVIIRNFVTLVADYEDQEL